MKFYARLLHRICTFSDKTFRKKEKPDFLCIGAQKAGTSWLYANLTRNDNVWMPPLKELHFFDHLFCPENRKWTSWHIKENAKKLASKAGENESLIKYLEKLAEGALFTEEWYKFAFSLQCDSGRLFGDITPAYCALPEEGIKYLKEFLGAPKIIYIIRDPLARVISQISMNALRKKFPLDADERQWRMLLKDPDLQSRGDYKAYIPRWDRSFSQSTLLYVPFGLLIKDKCMFLKMIEDFLRIGNLPESDISSDKIWASRKYSIPEFVLDSLRSLTAEQNAFLKDRFPSEFFELV